MDALSITSSPRELATPGLDILYRDPSWDKLAGAAVKSPQPRLIPVLRAKDANPSSSVDTDTLDSGSGGGGEPTEAVGTKTPKPTQMTETETETETQKVVVTTHRVPLSQLKTTPNATVKQPRVQDDARHKPKVVRTAAAGPLSSHPTRIRRTSMLVVPPPPHDNGDNKAKTTPAAKTPAVPSPAPTADAPWRTGARLSTWGLPAKSSPLQSPVAAASGRNRRSNEQQSIKSPLVPPQTTSSIKSPKVNTAQKVLASKSPVTTTQQRRMSHRAPPLRAGFRAADASSSSSQLRQSVIRLQEEKRLVSSSHFLLNDSSLKKTHEEFAMETLCEPGSSPNLTSPAWQQSSEDRARSKQLSSSAAASIARSKGTPAATTPQPNNASNKSAQRNDTGAATTVKDLSFVISALEQLRSLMVDCSLHDTDEAKRTPYTPILALVNTQTLRNFSSAELLSSSTAIRLCKPPDRGASSPRRRRQQQQQQPSPATTAQQRTATVSQRQPYSAPSRQSAGHPPSNESIEDALRYMLKYANEESSNASAATYSPRLSSLTSQTSRRGKYSAPSSALANRPLLDISESPHSEDHEASIINILPDEPLTGLCIRQRRHAIIRDHSASVSTTYTDAPPTYSTCNSTNWSKPAPLATKSGQDATHERVTKHVSKPKIDAMPVRGRVPKVNTMASLAKTVANLGPADGQKKSVRKKLVSKIRGQSAR